MSYGLMVEGEGGRLVIDPDYSGYAVHSYGTLAVNGGSMLPNVSYRQLSLPAGVSNPIILFRPPVGRLINYHGTHIFSHGGNVNLPFAILVPANELPQSSESHGLRVWDSQGRTVFDSGHTIADTLSTYTYRGTALPTVSAGVNDWIAADTSGVSGGFEDGSGQFIIIQSTYLEKLSSGGFRSHQSPVWRIGYVNWSNDGAQNFMSITRMALR